MPKTMVVLSIVLLIVSCGPSIDNVNTIDPTRIPPITGDTHEERVKSQKEIIAEQQREQEEQREEIRHLERQKYYNDLMRKKSANQ